MSDDRTYVEFHPVAKGAAANLTDAQWLALIDYVDERPGWGWALPAVKGEPARVLAPGAKLVFRVDADGTEHYEPWEPA